MHSDISAHNVMLVRGMKNVVGDLPDLRLSLSSESKPAPPVLENIASSSVSEPSLGSSSSALVPFSSVSEPSLASASSALDPVSSVPEPSLASLPSSVPDPSVSEPKVASSPLLNLVLDDQERAFWNVASGLEPVCGKYGLPYHVKSGGSIIDFDCTHSASEANSPLTRSVCLCCLYLVYISC